MNFTFHTILTQVCVSLVLRINVNVNKSTPIIVCSEFGKIYNTLVPLDQNCIFVLKYLYPKSTCPCISETFNKAHLSSQNF